MKGLFLLLLLMFFLIVFLREREREFEIHYFILSTLENHQKKALLLA